MPDEPMTGSQWSAGKIAEAATVDAPVAVEVTEGAPVAVDAPTGQEAASDATVEPVEGQEGVEGTEQPRNEQGQFAKVIKAKNGEAEMDLPEGLLLPLKRGEQVTMKPLADVLKEGMLYNDYQAKTAEASAKVRDAVSRAQVAEAEATQVRAILKEIREKPDLAFRLKEDPEMNALWEDSFEKKVRDAKDAAATTVSAGEYTQQGVQVALGWIQELAPQFEGVDPETVREAYATYLQSPQAANDPQALTPARIQQFYAREQKRIGAVVNPFKAELEKVKAELKALKSAKNANTDQALKRAAAPPTLGAGGNSGGAVNAGSKAIVGKDGQPLNLRDASAQWLRQKTGT